MVDGFIPVETASTASTTMLTAAQDQQSTKTQEIVLDSAVAKPPSDEELFDMARASGMTSDEADSFVEEYRRESASEQAYEQTLEGDNTAGVSTMMKSGEKKDSDFNQFLDDDHKQAIGTKGEMDGY